MHWSATHNFHATTVPDWQHTDPWIWDSAVALGNQCFKQGNDFCSYSGKKLHEEEHSSIKTNSTSFAETKHPEFKSFPDANFHHNSQAWCQYFYSACFWTRKKNKKIKRCHFTTYQVMCTIYSVFTSACYGAETTALNPLLVIIQTPDRPTPAHTEGNLPARGCRTSPTFSAAQQYNNTNQTLS